MMRKSLLQVQSKVLSEEDRVIEIMGTTPTMDRVRDVVDPMGGNLENYRKNPVFLWAHDYDRPPIGKSLAEERSRKGIKFTIKFARTPFAEEIFGLYRDGFLNAASIGFIGHEWEPIQDKDGTVIGRKFTRWELLELSAVPVPANPDALALAAKGLFVEKGVVPGDVSREKAPEDTSWSAPTLSDFTDEAWDDLSVDEKRRIAGHFAWAASMPPENFGDLKLPHHRPSDGAVVWRGVAAAMAALMGARG
ncbi:MAG TPA: HK97 family phage prohead protease, partial [Thermaerobacter sp.]